MIQKQEYLGDGVYASFDGDNIWLSVGHHDNRVVALEKGVYNRLREFAESVYGSPLAPVPAIDSEAHLLNMVNIRAEMRDMIIRAAKQFKAPIVTHEERDGCYYTVIMEGATDA